MLFIHLSDIHFRDKEIAREDDPNAGLRDDVYQDVRHMREKLGRSVDGVLISGDIAFGGMTEEYEFATRWLEEKLCPAAGCTMDDVFIIPGNHDVDRSKAKGPLYVGARRNLRQLQPKAVDAELRSYLGDEESSKLIFAPLENYNKFAAKFLCSIGRHDEKHPEIKPYVKRSWPLDDGSKITFWGFSSVLVSDAQDDEKLMFVDPMGTQITREDGVVHAVMCHHPYNWLRNGTTFKSRIEQVASLHLFGHEHSRRVDENRHFTTVRAGALQPERDEEGWDPGYNWIDVSVETSGERRTLHVRIWVRKWEEHRFIAVPDRGGNDPWDLPHDLPAWKPPTQAPSDGLIPEMAPPSNPAPCSPNEPPHPNTVARNMLKLAEHEQRQIIVDLHLDKDGDQGLRDYQFVIAAIARATERNQLVELNAKALEIFRARTS